MDRPSKCVQYFYLISDSQVRLQCLLDIASNYGQRFRIKYGVSKTKITRVSAEVDKNYFLDTKPRKMDGEQVKIVDLGQIVSDIRQEQNNIDLKLRNGRGTLFKLLGPAFAYKYLLSPPVKRLSVLSSTFPLNERISEPMCIFQRKVLGSILKLSKTEQNPETKIYQIVKYLMENSCENSRTRPVYIKQL